MFNISDYNENVEYCEYVYKKNEELGLGLRDSYEIQVVANMYVDEMYEKILDQYIENDEVLLKVVEEYMNKIRNTEETIGEIPDEFIDLRLDYEKRLNAKGGYDYNDGYDDESLSDRPHRL